MGSWVNLRRVGKPLPEPFNCAWLDMEALASFDPELNEHLIESETNITYAVQWAKAMYGDTVNLKYFTLGGWTNTYSNAALGLCIYGADSPKDQNANFLVDFKKSGGYATNVGERYSTIFQQQSYRTPPPDLVTANDYFVKGSSSGKDVYSITHTFTPDQQGYWNVSTNSFISDKFFTTTGNSLGCCVGIGTSEFREFACVGTDYLNGYANPYNTSANNIGLSPAVQDNRDGFGGGGWMYNIAEGSAVPGYNTNSIMFSHDDPYNYAGTTSSDPAILHQVSVQLIATQIEGKNYIGMAALGWLGETISSIQVVFLPTWFWGEYNIDPEYAPPSPDDYYFGPPQEDASGGNGTYKIHVDVNQVTTVPVSPLESIGNLDSGIHIYRITPAHLKALTNYLWSGQDTYEGNALNLQQGIISLLMLPKEFLDKAIGTNPEMVNFVACARKYLPVLQIAPVEYLNSTAGHWITLEIGSVNLPLYYGTFHDYEGYTSIQLNLPFIGTVSIAPSLCNGGSIKVYYHCDITTGNVVAEVVLTAKKNLVNTDALDPGEAYQYVETKTIQYYSGSCGITFPIYGSSINPADIAGGISGAIGGVVQIAQGVATGNFGGAIGGAFQTISGVNQAMYPPVSYSSSSTYAGSNNAFNNKQCSVVITRPKPAFSDAWVGLKGTASSKFVTSIGMLHVEGQKLFTVIDYAKTSTILSATNAEKLEIEKLLREGVYV